MIFSNDELHIILKPRNLEILRAFQKNYFLKKIRWRRVSPPRKDRNKCGEGIRGRCRFSQRFGKFGRKVEKRNSDRSLAGRISTGRKGNRTKIWRKTHFKNGKSQSWPASHRQRKFYFGLGFWYCSKKWMGKRNLGKNFVKNGLKIDEMSKKCLEKYLEKCLEKCLKNI